MSGPELAPAVVFALGPLEVTRTVVATWVVMGALVALGTVAARPRPGPPTLLAELLGAFLELAERTAAEVVPLEPWRAVPVLATLWLLVGAANLAGLVPGLVTPTSDVNTTFALALVSFSLAPAFGIATQGARRYLAHYAEPTWILAPFHVVAELTRTVALAVRLFGNMLSGEMIAAILLGVAGLLVPVPFALLHVLIGLIQAYIFGVLTLVFIAQGMPQPEPGKGGTP